MVWAIPQNSRNSVDRAGSSLLRLPNLSDEEIDNAFRVIDNWRASHSYPMNTFQVTLRNKSRSIDMNSVVSQRLKRIESIFIKLLRARSMKLSRMQDIGGCRSVLSSVKGVRSLESLYENSRFDHVLSSKRDYIIDPKDDGYRSLHLIYRYQGRNDKTVYNDLRIEVQLRSRLQHAWATAVETAGSFTQQALKSGQGSDDWRRFFSLVSSGIAEKEGCPPVPGCPMSQDHLIKEIRYLDKKLNVLNVLETYRSTIEFIDQKSKRNSKYYLILLDPVEMKAQIRTFRSSESEKASTEYTNLERQYGKDSRKMVALVSADSVNGLKNAYPNFFGDTKRFVDLVRKMIS
ncbi:MAG: RelA/SpoT domain-containing protein [Azospirillaceae bacterium]